MASDVVKGGWAPDEDERLINAIEKYGTRYGASPPRLQVTPNIISRWSLVATLVQSRNSDRTSFQALIYLPNLVVLQNVQNAGLTL